MSVITETTNHEFGGKGDSRIAPTGGKSKEESLLSVAADTTLNESGVGLFVNAW